MSAQQRIAIIGAGVSGLGAALSLTEAGHQVTVFEKSRGVSGRAASKTREGIRIDYGANYFKTDQPNVAKLVLHRLPTEELIQIKGDIWTFDKDNQISPGDPNLDAQPKWNYTSGISTLGKLIARECNADIRFQTRIRAMRQGPTGRWRLMDENGVYLEEDFDIVVFAIPAGQAQAILAFSEGLSDGLARELNHALSVVDYHRQLAFVVAWNYQIAASGDFYALINSDRQSDLSWLSFEGFKSGRVSGDSTVLLAQMAPPWSDQNYEAELSDLLPYVQEKIVNLLGPDFAGPPSWYYSHRWGFSLPRTQADSEILAKGKTQGLYFIGDMLVGKGRVGDALATGLSLQI